MKFKKSVIIPLVIISILGYIGVSYGAIAVIDTQNIVQQAKTYAETARIVTNTAQQITLQIKELASWPADVLNSYTSKLTSSINQVTNTVKGAAFNFGTGALKDDIEGYWESTFKSVDSNTITDALERAERKKSREKANEKNKGYLKAYKDLTNQLETQMKAMNDLVGKNASVEGQKQSQQLQNQMLAVQANIDNIKIAMQTLNHKRQLEKEAAEIKKAQDEANLRERHANETTKMIQKLDVSSTEKFKDNPYFQRSK